ncbi:MAG: hypothetical protein FJ290_23610 [Planctomycetes bacterium]|nr:hypothetical protein [Planctomycetota bacterium]
MANREHARAVEPAPDVEPRHRASAPVHPRGPSAAEFVASLSREHVRNLQWLLEHEDELAKYEGQWVLVAEQRIYCTGRTQEEVEERALQDGLKSGDFLLEYVFPFDISLLAVPGH